MWDNIRLRDVVAKVVLELIEITLFIRAKWHHITIISTIKK